MYLLLLFLETVILCTLIFIYFRKKGRFHLRHLYIDNIILIFITTFISVFILYKIFTINFYLLFIFFNPLVVLICFVFLTLFRFYRNPKRKIRANENEFISPADGQIIYIKEINSGDTPFSVKGKTISRLDEITKTDILKTPCYLIGIIMTLFDVHINRAPMNGKVILSQHTSGSFIGLKKPDSTIMNERNTIVIKKNEIYIGIVQIASRFVKRCISSVQDGDIVEQGAQIGCIRWGSQVDIILPSGAEIKVKIGDQVFAGKTIIAELK
jgi:phosphatidylserine decarboxylase